MSFYSKVEIERWDDEGRHGGLACDAGGDRTKQEFKDDCDILQIMAKMERTGVLTHAARFAPRFMDVSEVGSYQEAMFALSEGQQAFESLPSKTRAEFANDPGKFLDFIADERNYDRAVELGLVPKRAEEAVESNEAVGSTPKAKGPKGAQASSEASTEESESDSA